MSNRDVNPPIPPKSWAGLPRALAKHRNKNKSSSRKAATATAKGADQSGPGAAATAKGADQSEPGAAGDRTKYSVDFDNIEVRYGQQLALGRNSFKDQSFAILIGTKESIPGLNAILLSIVRTAHFVGAKVYFVKNGLRGLHGGRRFFEEVTWSRVTDTAGLTNCIIDVESCPASFDKVEVRRKEAKNLIDHLALNLVVIGEEETLEQAIKLKNEWGDHVYELIEDGSIRTEKAKEAAKKFQLVGIIASAESDFVGGSDLNELLGMDTELQQITELADDIDNTTTRYQRVTVLSVHGLRCGALAARAALLLEADWLFTPESPPMEGWETELAAKIVARKSQSGTLSNVVVVAEGSRKNDGEIIDVSAVCQAIKTAETEVEIKVHQLGHCWTGSPPSCFDRVIGFRFGVEAVLSCIDQFLGIPPHKESVESATTLSGGSSEESTDSIDPAVSVILCIQGNSLMRVSLEAFLKSFDKWRERLKNKLAKGASNDKYRSEAYQHWICLYDDVMATEARDFPFASKYSDQGQGDSPPVIQAEDQPAIVGNVNVNRFVIPRRHSSSSSGDSPGGRRSVASIASRQSGKSGRSSRRGGVCLPDERVSLGIVFVGVPCGGMNSCLFAFSRFAKRIGCRPIGFTGGTKGMCDVANVKDLTSWYSVQGHLGRGGCALGVGDDLDFLPEGESLKLIAANLGRQHIQGLLIVGGFKAFQTALKFHRARDDNQEFRIPMKVIPATTFGNMPGTDISLGCDTNLNQILEDINDLRHSSEGSLPVLHVVSPAVPHEAEDGHNCGFLTTVAALAANAEGSYVLEENFDETDIKADALQYKCKMYDGMRHGVFFMNNTWTDGSVEDEENLGNSIAGTRKSSAKSSHVSQEDRGPLGSIGSLKTFAKGGLKGIIELFKEYARNPEECGKSEYRVCHSTLASRCGAGRPSAMDRQLGVTLTVKGIEKIMTEFLEEEEMQKAQGQETVVEDYMVELLPVKEVCHFPLEAVDLIEVIGIMGARMVFTPVLQLIRGYDFRSRTPKNIWWLALRPIAKILSAHFKTYDYLTIDVYRKKRDSEYKSDPDWIPELEEKIRQLENGDKSDDDDEDNAADAISMKSGMTRASQRTSGQKRRRIVVVRNTMTQLRENRVFQGWLDVPLNEDGEREARYLGALFKINEIVFDVVFTSFLNRHTTTAYYIQSKMHLEKIPNHKSWRLNSRMLGQLEGMSRLEAVEKFGGGKVTDWCNSPFSVPPAITQESAMWAGHDPRYADVAPSDIPVAESQSDTMDRFLPFWNRIIKPTLETNDNILIVAGKNVQRAILKIVYAITDSELDEWELEFDALKPLVVELDKKWRPLSYSFLEGEGVKNFVDSEPNLDPTSSGQMPEGEGKEDKGGEGGDEADEEEEEEEDEE